MLTMGTAGLRVESLVGALSRGGLLTGEVQRLGRLFITVILVAELRRTVASADRQIRALTASVAVRELAIEVFGIGWILVAKPVPALPQPVDVRVMEIEHRVAADSGEFGHIASEGEMSEEVRVLIETGIEPQAAVWRVDVELLVESVQRDPVPIERIDALAVVYPEPASAVVQRAARDPEHRGDNEIIGVSSNRIPVREREVLVVQHLANDPLELIQHQSMPGKEIPLLIVFGVGRVVGVRLATVPDCFGVGSIFRRECR